MAEEQKEARPSFGELLGARRTFSLEKLTLYFPNQDRGGNKVTNLETYIETAMVILAETNGGVTRMPPAVGMWLNQETGEQVHEDTVVIYSYITDEDRFWERFRLLKEILHRFGRETNQGEVMVELSGDTPDKGYVSDAYFIDDYDDE